MPWPSSRFGKPLAALRVRLATADGALVALVRDSLAPLGIEPVWTADTEPVSAVRCDVLLWDAASGMPPEAAALETVCLLRTPGEGLDDGGILLPEPLAANPCWSATLRQRLRASWRYVCLLQECRHYEVSWEEAVREKASFEAQVDRNERNLLASYRDLQRHHEALVQKTAELEKALEAEALARAVAEEREKLLMQVVHDQRTDLMNIAFAADLARKLPDSDQALASIQVSLQRIDSFLSEKISHLKESRSTLYTILQPAMARLEGILAGLLAAKDLRLSVVLPAVNVTVPLSAIEFEQVAINLLNNAIKFSPRGGEVRLSALVQGSTTILRVEDEGPGIPEALFDRIGSGVRADDTVPGSGLGLKNVQALLERVGGTVSWRNGERGAVFEALLPLVPV